MVVMPKGWRSGGARGSWRAPRGFPTTGAWSFAAARNTLVAVAPPLLDREAETSALERHLASVRAGAGCTVLVDGPAGIGKSSLLAHTARLAGSSGFRVLSARGGPLEQTAGWGIARQLLGPVLRGGDWAELAVGAAALARRALEPEPDTPPLRGDAVHAAAYGLSWLVAGLAERSP